MSFYDDASLVFLPSGEAGKDGKAYSMKPTDGSGDFTFSRGSNLTATRIDSNGLIEKGRENLLLQSNQFDTTWTTTNASVTSGQSGYDGSNDAWLLSKSAAGGQIRQNVTSSGVNTYSVYAKSGALNWLRFFVLDSSNHINAFFDLQNGEVGLTQGNNYIDSSIESIGSGWYRCSVTFSAGTTQVRIYPADGNNDTSGTSGSIYIQDAQLEIGLTSTEYIESGASTGLAGLLEDSPRFDYSGGASCPSLLLEPSRTNILEYSEYIDSWTTLVSGTGLTPIVTNNYTISPEGVKNATRLQLDIGTGTSDADFAQIQTSVSTTTGTTYAGSIYFKSNTGVNQDIVFQINGQSIVATTITPQWARYDVSAAATSTGGFFRIRIRGNEGTNKSADFSVYGAQLEEGSYPTSYIPNHSGGSVTRNGDVCEGAGTSSTFNATEGVFYAEISTKTDDTDKAISLNNGVTGSLNNRLWMGYSTSNKRIYALGYVNNSLQFALNKLMTDESLFVKIACRYKRDDIAFFVNGEKVGTDTSALNFTELSSLDFNIGTGISGASPLYGNVKQVLVFNSYLSDANCITLTS